MTERLAGRRQRAAPTPTHDELLLAEARVRFERQEKRIDDIRSRTLTIVGAAGVVTGLFATLLRSHHTGVQTSLAVAAFVSFAGCVALALTLQLRIKFSNGERLDGWLVDDYTPRVFARRIAQSLNDAYGYNASGYDKMIRRSTWVVILFGLEIACWAIAAIL